MFSFSGENIKTIRDFGANPGCLRERRRIDSVSTSSPSSSSSEPQRPPQEFRHRRCHSLGQSIPKDTDDDVELVVA